MFWAQAQPYLPSSSLRAAETPPDPGTVVSVFVTAASGDREPMFSRTALLHGGQFTAALLAILVAHELGHFVAAKIHKVDASLPYFIPLPFLFLEIFVGFIQAAVFAMLVAVFLKMATTPAEH